MSGDAARSGSEAEECCSRLFRPIDSASLVWFRVAFGGIMLWECWRYFTNGWIRRYWIDPDFHFKYFGFGWVEPLPGIGMYLLWAVIALASLGILLGCFYRTCATIFFLSFTYVFLLDQATYLNHFYFVILVAFLAIWIPANRCCSIDVRRRPALGSQFAPAWSLWILRAQMGIVYYFGALAKANADWLQGEPMRIWLRERRDFPVVGPWFETESAVFFFSLTGLVFDLAIVPLLLWKRTRLIAFLGAVVFHLTNSWIFTIGIFPWLSLAMTALFFDPSWPRILVNRLRRTTGPVTIEKTEWFPYDRRVVICLGVFFAIQCLFPLRHFLYPGNVNWTEEGHRFSWHMKLRTKSATIEFMAIDPVSGQTWVIEPRQFLRERQYRKMRGRPDMIHQFCREIARRKRVEGFPEIKVHALVKASLNGRQPQFLIDPETELGSQPRSLRHAEWIVPLVEPLK